MVVNLFKENNLHYSLLHDFASSSTELEIGMSTINLIVSKGYIKSLKF